MRKSRFARQLRTEDVIHASSAPPGGCCRCSCSRSRPRRRPRRRGESRRRHARLLPFPFFERHGRASRRATYGACRSRAGSRSGSRRTWARDGAAISPDCRTVAFSATYDGPTEVYVMPLDGGSPRRLTWDGLRDLVVGWTPKGEVLLASRRGSGFRPDSCSPWIPPGGARRAIALSQASEGAWTAARCTSRGRAQHQQHAALPRRHAAAAVGVGRREVGGEAPMPQDSAASRTPMPWQGRCLLRG